MQGEKEGRDIKLQIWKLRLRGLKSPAMVLGWCQVSGFRVKVPKFQVGMPCLSPHPCTKGTLLLSFPCPLHPLHPFSTTVSPIALWGLTQTQGPGPQPLSLPIGRSPRAHTKDQLHLCWRRNTLGLSHCHQKKPENPNWPHPQLLFPAGLWG